MTVSKLNGSEIVHALENQKSCFSVSTFGSRALTAGEVSQQISAIDKLFRGVLKALNKKVKTRVMVKKIEGLAHEKGVETRIDFEVVCE